MADPKRPETLALKVDELGSVWLTADRATTYLGFSTRRALYQAVRRGTVPVHRLGSRRMRFNRLELDRLLGKA